MVNKMELALKALRSATAKTKIVEAEGSTGYSFFEGKDRLGKVLKTKKGFCLEINVVLPKAAEERFNLAPLPYSKAHAKHLGTMKYEPVRTIEDADIQPLIAEMVKAHKAAMAQKAQGETNAN